MEFSLLALDYVHLGLILLPQAFAKPGSALSVLDAIHAGLPPLLRSAA